MEPEIRMTKNGIRCVTDAACVHLDPKYVVSGEINFVSHAHSDHLPSKSGGSVIASHETMALAGLRGVRLSNHAEPPEEFEMIDSGHVLGSRGVLFHDVFYTGDICTRDRGFLKAARIPRCNTLLTECTFGMPEFSFPSTDSIRRQVNEIISGLYGKGVPVILMGYQLGKSQMLTWMFSDWDPLYLHDSVRETNSIHREFGVGIRDAMGHTEAQARGMLDKRPWVMIAPMMPARSRFVQEMKSKYGAVTIGFSGWAMSSRFPYIRNTDYSIPMSDHCDFGDLIRLVNESGAQRVYTVHGFVDEFAECLRKAGIDASPLRETSMDQFI